MTYSKKDFENLMVICRTPAELIDLYNTVYKLDWRWGRKDDGMTDEQLERQWINYKEKFVLRLAAGGNMNHAGLDFYVRQQKGGGYTGYKIVECSELLGKEADYAIY